MDRERWLFYTDPDRQRQRAKRGLPPSVIVGIDSLNRNPFREARRHAAAAAPLRSVFLVMQTSFAGVHAFQLSRVNTPLQAVVPAS